MFLRHLSPQLLFLPAQDIDDHQLSRFEKLVADYLPSSVSIALMNCRLGQLLRHTVHLWNPPLKHDAEQILLFTQHALTCDCQNLIVACEFGRSRSVATAHFIASHFKLSYTNDRIGNLRIQRLLTNAIAPKYSGF